MKRAAPLQRAIPSLLALAAGLAQAWSTAAPWDGQPQGWLQIASLAVLARLLAGAGGRAGFFRGWLFAIAWLAGTFWWLFVSMHTYGGLPAPLAVAAVLGLAAFLGLYYGAAGALHAALPGGGPLRDSLRFACLWLAAELARASWFTGFPWGAGGYAHVDGLLGRLAPLVGVYGIGFVASWMAALLAGARAPGGDAAASRPAAGRWRLALGGGAAGDAGRAASWSLPRRLAVVGAAGLAVFAAGSLAPRLPAAQDGRPLSVALLQGNIPQDEKFESGSGIPLALDWYGRQLAGARAALVVAPETALPLLPQQLPEGYMEALRRAFASGGRAMLAGLPLGGGDQGYTNSVLGLAPGLPDYRYDKFHLVPFGEFIPPLFKWFTRMMNIPLGDFDRGPVGQRSLAWAGQRLAPNICYEDLFGEDLAARFREPASAPTVLVNLSNIGWFGNTIAIDQHLQISRMRALEFARPMIRATNTGATAIIDREGRVTHSLPRHTRGVLHGEVVGGEGVTPYARWMAAAGLWPLWLLALGGGWLAARPGRRRPH